MKKNILLFLILFTINLTATTGDIQKAQHFLKNAHWVFEENKGQVTGTDSNEVKFFYKKGNLTMFLLKNRIAYQFDNVQVV